VLDRDGDEVTLASAQLFEQFGINR
jgi:hypothetical protein